MGMVTSAALATLMAADVNLLVEIPEDWSMEDAATAPVVYATVMYSFFVVCTIVHKKIVCLLAISVL